MAVSVGVKGYRSDWRWIPAGRLENSDTDQARKMGKRSQIRRSREAAGIFVPISRTALSRSMRGREWRQDLLLSWLFQTCIALQASLNRRFLRFGMTVQEASVLLRCVEARKISPGELSTVLGRDKGMITRFIDRLEASRLVTRDIQRRDRRFSVIRPTGKGKQIARALAGVFEKIRKELFTGILESDEFRLGRVLPQLHKNATRIGSRQRRDAGRGGRVGSHGRRKECGTRDRPQLGKELVTASPNGHAANTLAAEQGGHDREVMREEQSGSDENLTRGKLAEEHAVLVLK